LFPERHRFGVLLDPKYPDADLQLRELQEAAAVTGKRARIAVMRGLYPLHSTLYVPLLMLHGCG
jgi:hypothetical protein